MSWHTILEDAAGVTVADAGHHPFTSAGLFFKALDGNFRVKIHGQNAVDLAPILFAAVETMDKDPVAYKEFEGPNGSLDDARDYLVNLRMFCMAYPEAVVRVIGNQADHTTAGHVQEPEVGPATPDPWPLAPATDTIPTAPDAD